MNSKSTNKREGSLSRRNMLAWTLKAAIFAASLTGTAMGAVTRVWAEAKRFIVPKGTNPRTLVNRNPAEIDASLLEITPLSNFQTMGLSNHKVDIDAWRLVIKGDVENPVSLTYEELVALPAIERKVFMICPGVFTNQGLWKGVSVKSLLDLARPKNDVKYVDFRGPATQYPKVQSAPLEDILSDKVFLAYNLNGERLPIRHGFPLRLVAEDYYGHDWVKYVSELKLRTDKSW